MEWDERSNRKRKRGGQPRRRNAKTPGEEDIQERRIQGRKSITVGQWDVNQNDGRNISEQVKSAQNELQEIPVDSDSGATARTTASKDNVGLTYTDSGNDHARWEKAETAEEKQEAKRKNRNRKSKLRKRRNRHEKRESVQQENTRREKEASTLREQMDVNHEGTTGVGAEEVGDDIYEDDFDIDIYGDEETRRKYGKCRRVA